MRFLVDSGSEVSLVRPDIYRRIANKRHLQLEDTDWNLTGVGGTGVTIKGLTTLPMEIGKREYSVDALVADIHTPGVLGMNFFAENDSSWNGFRGELILDKDVLFLEKLMPAKTFQVKTCQITVIPPRTEKLIPVRSTGHRKAQMGVTYCVSPTNHFAKHTGLVVGGTVVTKTPNNIPVLVFNPTETPILIEKGVLTACCSPAVSIRELQGQNRERNKSLTTSGTESHLEKNSGDGDISIPEHLEQMIPKDRLNLGEQDRLREFLTRYSDVFLEPGGTLGRTSVTKHRITIK